MTVTGSNFIIPKDLAISNFPGGENFASIPVERYRCFQWGKTGKIKEDSQMMLNYCVLMAVPVDWISNEIVQEKIKVNNEKYPVSKAKGKKEKYNKLWNMFMKHLSEILIRGVDWLRVRNLFKYNRILFRKRTRVCRRRWVWEGLLDE